MRAAHRSSLPGFGHCVRGARGAISAAVLRWVSRCQASITHPVKSHTSSPVVSTFGGRRSARCGIPSRFGTTRNRCATAMAVDPASRTRCRGSSRRPSRCHQGVIRACSASVVRVCSISAPNCTPLGHAVSQPRHCTQVSTKSTNSSSIGSSPRSTARMASMRPRGEYRSSPVTRNVGQCGRQSPQLTQVAASSESSPSTDAPARWEPVVVLIRGPS